MQQYVRYSHTRRIFHRHSLHLHKVQGNFAERLLK